MVAETFYSALHWAKKAEASAKLAADLAQTEGKVIQLGFDGVMEDGVLVFKHAPGGVEAPYQLVDDVEYELDLAYNGDLDSLTTMVVKNGADTINFVSALHRSSTEPARVADMDAVMRYDTTTGYRWLFKATFKIAPNSAKVFLLYPVVAAKDYSDKTNCITEIPQDIKLELNNGTLTLKAGSKVYVPNGKDSSGNNVFDEVEIENDISFSGTIGTSSRPSMWFLGADDTSFTSGVALHERTLETQQSGASTPSESIAYYNTSENLIHLSGTTNTKKTCLPLCIITLSNGVITSIDQVFNGFGYIGSTVFALPGVKGLIPNGRNADGSLRNIEFVTSKVVTHTYGSETYGTFDLCLKNDNTFVWYSNLLVKSDNYLYNGNTYLGADKLAIGKFNINSSSDNGKIVSLTTKLPFRAVDRNDSSWIAGQAMPSDKYIDLTLGASGSTYTAPANGYFICSKQSAASTQYLTINNVTTSVTTVSWVPAAASNVAVFCPARKGDIVKVNYSLSGATNLFRFIYAEGEK